MTSCAGLLRLFAAAGACGQEVTFVVQDDKPVGLDGLQVAFDDPPTAHSRVPDIPRTRVPRGSRRRSDRADAIVHQATALADVRFSRNLDRTFALTNRLRREGTDALLTAAREAGVARFVAQSFANARYARTDGPVKTEDDPLDPTPGPSTRETNAAMRHLDESVTEAGGIALRYGNFYGASNDGLVEPVRKRQFPIVGDGGGVSSFVHLDDAAAATVLALEHDSAGVYNIVDDDPAPVRDWLPVLANALGAKPPRRVPRSIARLFAGEAAVMMGTDSRGASNAKAKRELGWEPRYPSWRQGFPAAYASASDTAGHNAHPAATPSHSPS